MFNKAQIFEVIELILLKQPNKCVSLKVPDLGNTKNYQLAQNSAQKVKWQHAPGIRSSLRRSVGSCVLKQMEDPGNSTESGWGLFLEKMGKQLGCLVSIFLS